MKIPRTRPGASFGLTNRRLSGARRTPRSHGCDQRLPPCGLHSLAPRQPLSQKNLCETSTLCLYCRPMNILGAASALNRGARKSGGPRSTVVTPHLVSTAAETTFKASLRGVVNARRPTFKCPLGCALKSKNLIELFL